MTGFISPGGAGGSGILVLFEGADVPEGTNPQTPVFRIAAPPTEIGLISVGALSTTTTPAASLTVPMGNVSGATTATAGSRLIAFGSGDAVIATPSGWTQLDAEVSSNGHYLWSKIANGTETNVLVDPTGTASCAGVILEFTGLDPGAPLEVTGVADNGVVHTRSTGATGATSGAANGLVIASMAYSQEAAATPTSTTGWSNGLVEIAGTDVATTAAAAGNTGLAVAWMIAEDDAAFETTGTFSTDTKGSAIIAVFAVLA